jgi:hypothetical protein
MIPCLGHGDAAGWIATNKEILCGVHDPATVDAALYPRPASQADIGAVGFVREASAPRGSDCWPTVPKSTAAPTGQWEIEPVSARRLLKNGISAVWAGDFWEILTIEVRAWRRSVKWRVGRFSNAGRHSAQSARPKSHSIDADARPSQTTGRHFWYQAPAAWAIAPARSSASQQQPGTAPENPGFSPFEF